MPRSVARQKSAFLFYQGDKLAEFKRELGPGASMGTAMTEVRLLMRIQRELK